MPVNAAKVALGVALLQKNAAMLFLSQLDFFLVIKKLDLKPFIYFVVP